MDPILVGIHRDTNGGDGESGSLEGVLPILLERDGGRSSGDDGTTLHSSERKFDEYADSEAGSMHGGIPVMVRDRSE